MGHVDPIRQIVATPVVTPRVSDGGARRQPQHERETPKDSVDIEFSEELDELEILEGALPSNEGTLDISV